jgi:hypothetical protein
MKRQKSESGQIAVILALAMIGLLAFTALAIDGGNSYLQKRNAQNAADAGAISGTREVHRILHTDPLDPSYPAVPDVYLRIKINEFVESNGVPDTTDDPAGLFNDNIHAFYLDVDGNRIGAGQEVGFMGTLPTNSRGVMVEASIPFDTFIAGIIGQPRAKATADAGAIYEQQTSSFFSAIYAGGNCTPHTLDLSGSYQYIAGGVHSNGNIQILGSTGNPSYYSGTVEYVGEINYQEDQIVFDNPAGGPTTCGAEEFGMIFSFNEFVLPSQKALDAQAAGMYYTYADNHTGNAPELIPADGLHVSFDPDGFSIPANFPDDVDLTVTLVAYGPIQFQADTTLWPYIDGMLLFSTYGDRGCPSNLTAITLSGNRFDWYGLVYAPNGHIDMSASANSSLYGLIVGWTINLSGSEITIIYDPEYDPPPPPRVVLVW